VATAESARGSADGTADVKTALIATACDAASCADVAIFFPPATESAGNRSYGVSDGLPLICPPLECPYTDGKARRWCASERMNEC
jgi:hypothetical protein